MRELRLLKGTEVSIADKGICRGTTGNVFEVRNRAKIVFDKSGSNVRGFGVEIEHWNNIYFKEDSFHIRFWKYHVYFIFTRRSVG